MGPKEPRIHENWQEQIENEASLKEWVEPLWKTVRGRWKNNHPHAAPNPPVKRLLLLLSEPGDLVVDPFAGGGNMLRQAKILGRKVIGYEIERRWAITASNYLEVSLQESTKSYVRLMLEDDERFSDEMIDLIEDTH
jgi:DNA modification methylase